MIKESELQRAVSNFLTSQEKFTKAFTWFHVPNSIRTNKYQASIHKAYGMRAGVPDCVVVGKQKTVWVELKTPNHYLSPKQKEFHEILKALGQPVHIVKSQNALGAVKQVEQILKMEGIL